MFSKNIFAQRLKMLRKSRKCTQLTLAELLGITRTQISDLENGKTSTSIERLCMLADYFNVSIDYLGGKNESAHRADRRLRGAFFSRGNRAD